MAAAPFLEMGVNDDWSYTFTAKRLAETGHLTYNGWAAFPIGAQAYWAALWVRLFGFSFTLVRLTTLPFAAGCAWLLYVMHRKVGVGPNASLLATLTVVLSPLFLPLAASFMTDVPSLFFFLLALYGYACALEAAPQSRAPLDWLAAATLAGLMGTTIRQSIWLVPMLCLPYAAWLRRSERRFVVASGVLWLTSGVTGMVILDWYKAQLYSAPDSIGSALRVMTHHLSSALQTGALMTCMLALLLLPVLMGSLFSRRAMAQITARSWVWIVLFVVAGLLVCAHARNFAPWFRSVLGIYGVYGTTFVVGQLPRALAQGTCAALTVLALALTGLTAAWLAQRLPARAPQPQTAWPALLRLLLPVTGVYAVLAFTRPGVFDRYLLPIMPAATLILLWIAQQRQGDRARSRGYAALGLWTAYGIAALHNHFAMGRARCDAAALLIKAGVPRTQILAGLDYDGWTQIAAAGYINNPAMLTPLGAPRRRADAPSIDYQSDFYDAIPSVRLRYAVVTSPQATLITCRIPPVPYTAWLPPFHRSVFIQRVPDAPEPLSAP